MAEVIKFTDAVNLGFHAMVFLAKKPEVQVPLGEIATFFKVSEAHLSKVLQRLGKAGLVRGSRGPTGGYRMTKAPKDVFLLELYEAIEGTFKSKFCLFDEPMCGHQCCGVGEFVGGLNERMREYLEKTSLEQLDKAQDQVRKGKKT